MRNAVVINISCFKGKQDRFFYLNLNLIIKYFAI